MARQQFDLIVFDWDGTLMDSTAHITRSIQAACRDLSLPVPADEAASYVIGLGLRDEGYLLAVATGKNRVCLNRALDQSRPTSLFDGTHCADETFSKPHPAMLHELTRELGQDVSRTVMIGDTTHDLQMAKNAGAAAVGVTYGAHPAKSLQALELLFVAENVTSLETGCGSMHDRNAAGAGANLRVGRAGRRRSSQGSRQRR
ncbi:MAG: Similar to phosphoglycolate phosphatase, clustered with ribosomal large subunit pseudouridine synthase C [uncultured Caballeronia sp.]|nr:MAG: Similar to phosphoglycolate phosphatase, clustered with ribosomal large subunit pseudouridine synthase C [uncultured Caballeronia sp.]